MNRRQFIATTTADTALELGYRGDINPERSGQLWSQKGYDPTATAIACYRNLSQAFGPRH